MPLIKRDKPNASAAVETAPASGSLQQMLASGAANERWAAARAMADDADAAPVLASALEKETAPEVRDAIFTSLVLIRTPEAAESLARLIRSDDAQLRSGALDGLSAMIDVARPLLPALLRDDDADVRLLACELVRRLDGEEATELLVGMLADEQQANVCGAAVDVLSETGTAAALGVLQQCAQRFAGEPFLKFAIDDAIARVSQRPARNG